MSQPSVEQLALRWRPYAAAIRTAADSQRAKMVDRAIGQNGKVRAEAIPFPAQVLTWYLAGNASVATNVEREIRVPVTGTALGIDIHAKTWPVGANLAVGIVRNGADTVASVSLAPGGGTQYASAASTLNAGDALRLDVTGIGSTTPGANITVNLIFVPTA